MKRVFKQFILFVVIAKSKLFLFQIRISNCSSIEKLLVIVLFRFFFKDNKNQILQLFFKRDISSRSILI